MVKTYGRRLETIKDKDKNEKSDDGKGRDGVVC